MDILKNKRYENYSYRNRYSNVPYYYNSEDQKDIYGLGSNMRKDLPYTSHKVIAGDNLDALALKYYANPSLWWVIAYFNDIQDSLINLIEYYKVIKIPNLSSIEFGDERH